MDRYLLPLGAQHPSYRFCPFVCLSVSDRYEDTLVVRDFGNIFTRLPLKQRFPEVCKGVGSPRGSGWVRELKSLSPYVHGPRHCCCVLGTRYAWIPPAPTPRPPPPTSTTRMFGRLFTSPSRCPNGTCASERLWPLVVQGVAISWVHGGPETRAPQEGGVDIWGEN